MFWWLMKYVLLGPLLMLLYRPRAVGLESIPEGPAILAAYGPSYVRHGRICHHLGLHGFIPGRENEFTGGLEEERTHPV